MVAAITNSDIGSVLTQKKLLVPSQEMGSCGPWKNCREWKRNSSHHVTKIIFDDQFSLREEMNIAGIFDLKIKVGGSKGGKGFGGEATDLESFLDVAWDDQESENSDATQAKSRS